MRAVLIEDGVHLRVTHIQVLSVEGAVSLSIPRQLIVTASCTHANHHSHRIGQNSVWQQNTTEDNEFAVISNNWCLCEGQGRHENTATPI